MRMLKLLVTLAGLAGILWWSGATVEASGCCIQDCYNAYFTMGDSGVPQADREAWLAECKANCEAHGDPSTCPQSGAY